MSRLAGRRALLCAQSLGGGAVRLTGIDFVQVVDPADQRVLRVFFIVEPDALDVPLAAPGGFDAFPLAAGDERQVFAWPDALAVSGPGPAGVSAAITAVHGGAALEIEQQQWLHVSVGGIERICLALEMRKPGGFEPYRLTLRDGEPTTIDPYLGTIVFDFKQACETGYDCRREDDCLPAEGVDFPVDYLARDFHSFRRALLDFAAQRYPDWREPIEADMAVMLMEIMAYLGDEFAYMQDRHDGEARFASATQRASLEAHAALVDYRPGRGRPAHGEIVMTALAGGTGERVRRDATFWAAGEGAGAVPFTLDAEVHVHPAWNALTPHMVDPEQDCVARGATEILLRRPAVWDAGMTNLDPPPPPAQLDAAILDFLDGRRAMLVSDPGDAAKPRRAWPVTLASAALEADPLMRDAGGAPTLLLRVTWDAAEATPFDLPLDGLALALNIGAVTAGRKVTEFARLGSVADIAASFAGISDLALAKLFALPAVVEREGPLAAGRDVRPIVYRHGLAATEASSLRFDDQGRSRIGIMELEPSVALPDPPPVDPQTMLEQYFTRDGDDPGWTYFDDLLDMDLGTAGFTLEPGMWRTIRNFQLPFETFQFADYAGDAGWTVKFGAGEFGRAPEAGSVLRFDYYTDPGPAANIPGFAIGLAPMGGTADPALAAILASATNWTAFSNAVAAESRDSVLLRAPQQWRAEPRRAVRPEDYTAIIERMPWVQRARAVTRWTGSWQTDFVSADPLGSIEASPAQRAALGREIDCIRLAARDARNTPPEYLDIDLTVVICVARGFYEGRVLEDVRAALEPPGFFAPDNFTFGQALHRSQIEAAVQAVAGVAHVEDVLIRVLGTDTDLRPFAEPSLNAGPGQIIRLQNDYNRATLGLLRIAAKGAL